MKNNINITGLNQKFNYCIKYIKKYGIFEYDTTAKWVKCSKSKDCVHLFENNVSHYRYSNDWYNVNDLQLNDSYIPEDINVSKLIIYIPNHNICNYVKGIKYMLSVNTWINGYKIDLGSFLFNPIDTAAIPNGVLKDGDNEYHEQIEFDIIDPFELVYSDKWLEFRKNICNEPLKLNSTGSQLYVTLYPVKEYDGRYMMLENYYGGSTSFNISDDDDFLKLNLTTSLDPLGLKYSLDINKVYDWKLLDYFEETYNLITSHNNIKIETIIKNKDSAIIGPSIIYNPLSAYGQPTQYISFQQLIQPVNHEEISVMQEFFNSWDAYEDGWNFVGSLSVFDEETKEEIFTLVSNEVPITMDLFSKFINGCTEKIIDIEDMNITQYNVVNKIENKIVQLERQAESKSNILQPVFFKVKDTENLTLHPAVTENICINLNDYKSKVKRFILKIDDSYFEQIGSNGYGVLFKIIGNKVSSTSGIYYVLNENYELITTGKFNCVK